MNTHSMTCQDVRDTMVLFLYEEASAAEIQALRAHVTTCRPCADEWERLSSIAQTISRAESGQHRPELAGAFRRPAARPRSFGFVYVAAAALFVVIVGVAALAPHWRRAASPGGPSSPGLSARASASRGSKSAGGANGVSAADAGGTGNHAGTTPGATTRAASAGRTSGARAPDVTEDVLEAELRSLDQAVSTLESGHEEL